MLHVKFRNMKTDWRLCVCVCVSRCVYLVVVSLVTESDRRFLSAVGRKLNPPDHLTLNSCPGRPDRVRV